MGTRLESPPRQLRGNPFLPPLAESEPVGVAPKARSTLLSRAWKGLRIWLWEALPALVIGLGLFGVWQLLAVTGAVLPLFLPAPAAVVHAWWFLLTGTGNPLLEYSATTVVESLLGCALGAAVAVPLGYAIAHSRLVSRASQPYVAASQAMPAVAIAPLIGLWLGYGLAPVVAICALIVFFPMVITTVLGFRLVDGEIIDAARVFGAGRWNLLRYIELPLALPGVLAGLRTSLTLSITGAVVGEFVIGGKGLGELLIAEWQSLDSAGVFATLLTLAALAALFYGGMRLIERRFSYAEAPTQ